MPTQDDIQRVAHVIAQRFQPRKIILFGSRAHGTPRPDSDADLLVILPFDTSEYRMMGDLLNAIYPTSGFHLVPQTPEKLEHRYRTGDRFICDAVDRGIVLYEAAA
jgi:hypothetical protein